MTARRKPPVSDKSEQYLEPDQETVREVIEDDYRQPHSQGCMMPIMFAMTICMFGFFAWDRIAKNPVAPTVAPVVSPTTPVVDLSAFTAPIAAKLATDPAKAEKVAAAYTGMRDAIAGPAGERVTDSRIFESVTQAILTDLDTKGGVAVGVEIDNAVGAFLGMTKSSDPKEPGWEPIQFDSIKRTQLVQILSAIATAAEGVK